MTAALQQHLESAILSDRPLSEIVTLLRQYKGQGVGREEVYALLMTLRSQAADEATEDRILEVADFVVDFCAPRNVIWDR